jgi:hypothetical protein
MPWDRIHWKISEKSSLKWAVNGDPFGGERMSRGIVVNLLFLRENIIFLNKGCALRMVRLIFKENHFFLDLFFYEFSKKFPRDTLVVAAARAHGGSKPPQKQVQPPEMQLPCQKFRIVIENFYP